MIESIISWIDLTRAVAFSALILSIVNTCFSWRRGRLLHEQEKRKTLRLDATLMHCFYNSDENTGDRFYEFQLMVRNPSDSNNAISQADLKITYITNERMTLTAIIRTNEFKSPSFVYGETSFLEVPKSISARDTIAGWLRFHIPKLIFLDNEIESHEILIRDTNGYTTSLVPILVQEYRDEV